MERKEKCIKAETPHTNKWLGKQKRRAGGGVSENRSSGRGAHTYERMGVQRTEDDNRHTYVMLRTQKGRNWKVWDPGGSMLIMQ